MRTGTNKRKTLRRAKMSDNNKRGKFIVLEGLDGSGKGTQLALLSRALTDMGVAVHETAEPTHSSTGGLIRDALAGLQTRTPQELAALFLADRIFHNTTDPGIKNLLENGVTVICDRYYYSSFAYQGMDAELSWVMDMNLNCPEIIKPDICIFLDVPAVQCDERLNCRLSREIFENAEKMNRIRARFFEVFDLLKDRENIVVIDASRGIEEVRSDIVKIVRGLFKQTSDA